MKTDSKSEMKKEDEKSEMQNDVQKVLKEEKTKDAGNVPKSDKKSPRLQDIFRSLHR